ncbi:tetratricopeptide repeat protein [Methanotrichaceae archaeon M04Ac]|uniref:Tetratricopeptide repeat protein n=1 Tax=Candidatus Methanocrinis alkalitolerans TaxID=3033395 RepID=A0ABT5XH96_9EURY|nr:tetratricopeptide repeat protein [Candidatus Methanocrinis alkalitolerans]MCR3884098.1 tetratricopeptide repeat protein [Methanothrix sp.]MDF0594094.1 tetratricopeptide repeat protein [Candidatus Methanocrinis alkalitolerans]
MDQLVVLQEIFESYMRGGSSRSIDPKSISGDCADLVAALLESFEEGQIDENICIRLFNCLSDIYDIKRLGDICRLAGHLGVAARCYNKALSLTSDRHVRSVLLNNLGQVHARQGYLGRALHHYELAADGFTDLGDVGSLAHVLGNMGSAYRSSQNYDKAMESCRKSLDIFKSLHDDFGVAQMTGSLGRIYAETDEFDLALQHYEKSLSDFEGLGDQRQVAWLLNRMGRVNAEMGEEEVAIGYYHKSMEIFEGIGQQQNAGVVLSNIGRLYLDRGDYDLAADHLETSLDLIRKSMQPVRANAVSWLSAARSIQARELHQQALHSVGGADGERSGMDLFVEASMKYAAVGECYSELAATQGVGLPELEVLAGIARFASALVILETEDDADKAIKLAEEAVMALNYALSKTEDDQETPSVEGLRRSMMGVKEAWRIALAKDEPWQLTDVVADATEHFTQGVLQLSSTGRGCKEACGHLLPAFKNLGRSMTAMLKGEPPGDLSDSMTYLKRAESAFELAAPDLGMISPFQIREARLMVERLQDIAKDGKAQRGLLLETYQRALLLMGRVLTRAALKEAAELEVVRTWDESMNLSEERPLGKPKPKAATPMEMGERRSASTEAEPMEDREALPDDGGEGRISKFPLIRPVEDVLIQEGSPSLGGSVRSSESLYRPDGGLPLDLPLEEPRGAVEGTTSTIEGPDPFESPSSHGILKNPACIDSAGFKARRRSPVKYISKFATVLGADLGGILSGRSQFRTPRLQRWSTRAVLEFLVIRGFSLFLALVFLYLLIDLTHYFI